MARFAFRSGARRVLRLGASLGFALGGLSACGGASASGAGASQGKARRQVVQAPAGSLVTASGVPVTQETRDQWAFALKAFSAVGDAEWSSANCSKIISEFERAVKVQGEAFAEADFMTGLVHERCGDAASARRAYEAALRDNPKFCKAKVALALYEARAGNASAAKRGFAEALKNDPQCTEAYVNLGVLQSSAPTPLLQEALNNYRRALAIEADYMPAFNQMALLYLAWGKQADSREKIRLAEIVCKQATLVNPDYAPIYNTWGLIEVHKGDVIGALRMFEKATSLDTSLLEAYLNFGQITMSFRGYDDAERAFTTALKLEPQNYDATIGLGISARGLKKFKRAETLYLDATKIDARRPESYFNLGVLYQDYMNGTLTDMRQAQKYFNDFLSRAKGKKRYSAPLEEVTRRCSASRSKRRRRSTDCRPGRLQNIDSIIEALSMAG